MDKKQLSDKIEKKCHDGPFGPVEFGCTILEDSDKLTMSVYHMKVHNDYQGHGYGRDALDEAVKLASENNIDTIEITIGGGEQTERFLKKVGFENVIIKPEGGVRARQSIQDIRRSLQKLR